MKITAILVIALMLFMAWNSNRNARFCDLGQHEHTYSACFIIAALTLLYFVFI